VLAVGETTKLDVWASADGVLADWALSAQDRSGGDLIVAIDKATANAGTHATLTITLKNKPKGGLARYGIVSQSGMREMHWGAAVRSK
jgi:hypothetical protein